MKKAAARLRERLYAFHEALNRYFASEEEFLCAALKLLAAQVNSDRVSLFALGPRRSELILQSCLYQGLWLEMDERIHAEGSSPLRQLLGGRRDHFNASQPHGLLYIPLRSGSRSGAELEAGEDPESVLGVLRFERFGRRRAFLPSEVEAARLLAAELAEELARSRVGFARQRQLNRLEALTDLTAVFASSLRVEDGFRLILRGIVQHFGLDRVRLYLVDREKDLLRGELGVDVSGNFMSLRGEEVPLAASNEHRFARILRGEQPDVLMRNYEARVLYLPLTVQGQKTGLLIAENLLSQQSISADDAALLKSFAGQIALAVDNARLFEEVQVLSLYDSLTGLPVRRYFNQRFQEEMCRVERSDRPLSVAMVDIDYFKGLNDTYGHQIGDVALKELGRLLLRKLRKIDFPARYGGDEIMILLPQATSDDAFSIMSRLLVEVRGVRIAVPFSKAGEIGLSASIGIATYPEDGRTIEDLMGKADEALYWVKSRGRNGVSTFRQAVAERPSVVNP
ncbi:MAG: hypothetical protein A2X36_06210 [Elusimicrobia bacterium GWA2_69_24]|nr:MAG: hypothetical protein A2X36_06210 [Elusimicrobia bacterium GWA2_69_24]HBL18205.1 hypothetical protein [Elusimicrobiota bacterium]